MLKPAKLYEDQIRILYPETWFDPFYKYYTMSTGTENFNLDDSTLERHQFASVDKEGNVIGVITYHVDYETMSATSFGAIAFVPRTCIFMKDIRQAVEDIFFKYNMNRLSFYSVADNPTVRGYKNFARRYGGSICGYEHACCKLIDGTIHDIISFEIMAKDFKEHYKPRKSK